MPATNDELELITSPANSLVKMARQLATRRRSRHREGLYLIEGERALRTAVEHDTHIETIVLDYERMEDISTALMSFCFDSASRTVSMDHALFTSIADAEHPQPVIAVARIPRTVLPVPSTSIVALDAVRDPGNMGTIIRTASAAGIDGIALLPGCVDPYNPKTVRASAGTVSSIPVMHYESIHAILDRHFDDLAGTLVLAADAAGSVEYRDVDWEKPILLVVGNEAHGLTNDAHDQAVDTVRIPMAEGVESLNVAVATGILLFEMYHRRRVR